MAKWLILCWLDLIANTLQPHILCCKNKMCSMCVYIAWNYKRIIKLFLSVIKVLCQESEAAKSAVRTKESV